MALGMKSLAARALGVVGIAAMVAVLLGALAGEAAAKTKTKTFSSGTVNRPIPDGVLLPGGGQGSVEIDVPLVVKKAGRVKDLNVGVRITHADTLDLELLVTSPSIRGALLVSHYQGAPTADDDYGAGAAGCEGAQFTVFDDEAPTPIFGAPNPMVGSFQPRESLSALNRVKLQGKWRLSVTDNVAGDVGVVNCWQATIRYKPEKPKDRGDGKKPSFNPKT